MASLLVLVAANLIALAGFALQLWHLSERQNATEKRIDFVMEQHAEELRKLRDDVEIAKAWAQSTRREP